MKRFFSRLSTGLVGLTLLFSMNGALAASPETKTVHAAFWQDFIWIDNVQPGFLNEHGKDVQLFNYQGTVYMPLRTVGEWMGCRVAWIQDTLTVSLTSGEKPHYLSISDPTAQPDRTEEDLQQFLQDSANGIDVQIRPDISVMLDGVKQTFTNAKGEAVYPTMFRGCTYLPVRSVGQLCGKKVLWLPSKKSTSYCRPSIIFLYDPPTQQQLNEIRAYFAACDQLYTQISADTATLTDAKNLRANVALEQLAALKGNIQTLLRLSKPSALFFESYYYQAVKNAAKNLEEGRIDKFISYMSGEILLPQGTDWNHFRENFGRLMNETLHSIQMKLTEMHEVMDAIGA